MRAGFGAGGWLLNAAGLLLLHGLAVASPFDPHPAQPVGRTPFFDGWFTRVVDHEAGLSFAVIFGSFQPRDSSDYKTTWLALLYQAPNSTEIVTEQHFVNQSEVSMVTRSGTEPGVLSSFVWRSPKGFLEVNDSTAHLTFRFDALELSAHLSERVPWSASAPDSEGPEGWIGQVAPDAIACHYWVHSLASRADYGLVVAHGNATQGRGFAHMEGNFGRTFPTGWIWVQAMSAQGDAQLLLTQGRFVVLGQLGVEQTVLAYRSPRLRWDFRSTDIDFVRRSSSASGGWLELVAAHWARREELRVKVWAPPSSFSAPLFFPTPSGFSNMPGCVESYSATVELSAYRHGALVEERRIPLAALEFGGSFRDSSFEKPLLV